MAQSWRYLREVLLVAPKVKSGLVLSAQTVPSLVTTNGAGYVGQVMVISPGRPAKVLDIQDGNATTVKLDADGDGIYDSQSLMAAVLF